MIRDVAEHIWRQEEFHDENRELVQRSIRRTLPLTDDVVVDGSGDMDEGKILRLVQAATSLAGAERAELREAAYRVGVYGWRDFRDVLDNVESATKVIFGRLGNFPAVSFLRNGGRVGSMADRLPLPLWFDYEAHYLRNTVNAGSDVRLTLTDFQKRLWDSLVEKSATSFTAPTSAGKTFALQHHLVSKYLETADGSLVYLVPTRALISQITADIADIASEHGKRVEVSSVPLPPRELGGRRAIYVLTQERLQILLDEDPDLNIGALVVDEAQQVGDGSRGVILQTVVDRVRRLEPDAQLLFSSPQAANPGMFGTLFELDDFRVVEEKESPVAQNLLFVEQRQDDKGVVSVSLDFQGENIELGSAEISEVVRDQNRLLAAVAARIGRRGTNLVYGGAPARCERLAGYIYELREDVPAADSLVGKREELSEFLQEQVHEDYLLANTVTRGIGYHYGNMPSIVRRVIENYFRDGVIEYLVSTSTLLHGVNLAAQNLFLLNPTKGRDTPLSDVEFWNLAGRAGRLTKDFEGNIFVVEPSSWVRRQFEGERRSRIEPSLRNSMVSEGSRFTDFIRDSEHPSGQDEQLESSFVRLFNDARAGTLDETLSRLDLEEEELTEVVGAIRSAVEKVSVPAEITTEHINVSVYRQQEMWERLDAQMDKVRPSKLMPAHPLSGEAYDNYKRLFRRLHLYFEKADNDSHKYFALIARWWMRGESYAEMIAKQHGYRQDQAKGRIKLATTIRELLADIDQDLRFRYVKYMRCYIDLLASVLEENECGHLVERIPPVPLFLELGASSRSMVSLIGLGISRTSAGLIHEHMYDTQMNRDEVVRWLQQEDLRARGVPDICVDEVEALVAS